MWVAGPYLPGEMNDLQIFRTGLMHELGPNEQVEADDGYMGESPQHCKCPGSLISRTDQKKERGRIRMRHEMINQRMKTFHCLVNRFRHGVDKHSICFRAAAVLTQIGLSGGEGFYSMSNYDDRLTDAQVKAMYG